ncbi:MAG TPA: hypothetical protein VKB69_16840, partial [Micromonosporaceae bacterium]|nr:hypothetical protein [Micromonosporaceae bacterium]
MDSAIDHCLDELRRAFEDIDHWIHVPVFEFLVNIPEGNENDLYDLAGKYNDAALLHAGHAQDISAHINDLYTSWSGDGAAQAAQSSLQQYMQQTTLTTEAFQDMEGLVSQGAQDIESTKYMAILNLVMLLVTLIQVIMTLWCTFGATAAEGAGAIALCRQALITALRQLLEKLGSITVRGLAKLALKRGLQFAAFTALSKGGIYLIESGEGHNPTWDWKSFSGEMLDSFTTGFIGGPLSFGLRGPLAESVAMAGGQVGDNAFRKWRSELLGDSQWAKDWGLYQDPSTISLMDGVAQAGIFGAAMGAGGMKDRMPDLLGKVKADMDLAKLGDLGRLGEIDPLLERPALEPVGARADALSDTPAGTRSDARADDGRTGDVRADDARSADRQTDPSGGSHADEPTGRADAGDARPGEHGNDPVASANGHRDDAAVPAAGDGHPTSADPASDHPTTDGTGNTTHHTSDANGATGHDATGATGHDPGTAGDGTTADHSSGGSNADHARDQARFYEWKKRFEGRQTEAYDKQLASGLLEHDGKPPVRLTHDMASRVLDHRPEDLSPFGRRLHSFVEQHFTEVREDGTRLILDDAAIQATLADLGRAAETRAAPVGRSEPVRDDAREPADGTAERWVSADSRSELSNPLDHGRMLFGEVLDREFGEGWDRSSPENLARITDMVSQVLDTPRNALSDAHEGRMLRDFVVDKLTRAEDGAMSRTPLDATAMRERLREFYPETEREPVSAPDHEGRDHQPVDSRRPDEHGPDHRTPDHQTPDHQIPDHHGSDARTSDGDGDGDRGTARPRPTGPADVITSDPVTHTFLSRDPTPERPGFIRTNVVERTRFEMGFERFPVEELPGGVDSPEARAATHDAARMLVAEMHQREVAAMHEWLVDGKRPAETDMVRIGQTATAVMLKDGTLVAASSVRETRLSTATTEVRYGDPLPADLRPAGALDARDVVGHRVVADALDSVPENQRSLFHGRCGEPTVLSKLANTLEEPYRRDYLERAGVESLADLSPDRLAEYHRDFESYLRDRLDGGNIESHYSGGPDQGGEQFPCASDDLLIESFGLRSEYVDRLASEAYVDPEHGVVSLLAADDPLRANASALASAHPDWLVVVTHGRLDADSFVATFGDRQVELSHVEVARLIRTITADNDALAGRTKILLLSCDAGGSFTTRGGETTFASQLATRLSTEVVSPTDTVWISDRGAVRVAEHSPRVTYEGTTLRPPDTPDWVHAGADGTVSHGDVDGLLGRNGANDAHLSGEHWDSASAGEPGDINWHPEFPKTLPDDHPLLTPTDQIHTPEREALRDQIVQDVLGEAEPVT